jgi:hypothetical protein
MAEGRGERPMALLWEQLGDRYARQKLAQAYRLLVPLAEVKPNREQEPGGTKDEAERGDLCAGVIGPAERGKDHC